jgi:tetratricopeptide (TPR) repeat protein
MGDRCRWTTEGFIDAFRTTHQYMVDTSFVFVLGAGASKDSDIPTGGELVRTWLEDLWRRHDGMSSSLEEWATATNLDIDKFDFASSSSFYPQVFERRFGDYLDEGYAALERAMEEKKPSFGYSVLAQILSQTRHRIVVTTNFDNLVSDALYHFTEAVPLVCGHESLAPYIRARMRRPVIAKIHRDLLLNPYSDTKNTATLADSWACALKTIFTNFSPVFIGYGGNDGSLMGFLENKLEPGEIAGRMYWCYLRNKPIPPRVEALVRKHRGALVPIDGFDLLMLRLNADIFNYPLGLDDKITSRASARAALYRSQLDTLMKKQLTGRVPTSSATLDAVHALITPAPAEADAAAPDLWWVPVVEAWREPAAKRRDELLRDAARRFPDEPQVLTALAWHVVMVGGDLDEVGALVDRALEKHPEDVPLLTVRARLHRVARNTDAAEELFSRAIAIAPKNADALTSYAIFLAEDLGRLGEAEEIFARLTELYPQDRGGILPNRGEVLLVAGQLDAADAVWQEVEQNDSPAASTAIALFHRALIARLRGQSDALFLGYLKSLFSAKQTIEMWNFDAVFRAAERMGLPHDVLALYRLIATTFVDAEKGALLDQSPLWREIAPLRPERPVRPVTPAPD